MRRVAIYLRVSTGSQSTKNQRRELEAVAKRSDWQIVTVYEDAGISGAKGRDGRPGLDAMMKAVIRGLRAKGMGVLKIGRTLGVGTSVVQRVVRAG